MGENNKLCFRIDFLARFLRIHSDDCKSYFSLFFLILSLYLAAFPIIKYQSNGFETKSICG